MLSDGFLTRPQLARVIGCSTQTITNRELRGHLPQPERFLGRPVYGTESQQIVKGETTVCGYSANPIGDLMPIG